jgi:hypothetical protein
MKRAITLGLIMLILFISGPKIIFAQGAEAAVKNTLNNLFEFSKAKAHEKAALLIAYDGEDKNRIQKEAFNPANKEELNQVKRVCKKISALLDLSSKHEFGKFETKKDGPNENYIIEVNFISGEQKLVTAFSFIKTEKGYLLININ